MKGLSIVVTISLFIFAGILAQILKRSGALPSQISARAQPPPPLPKSLQFVNYADNNPHHLN